MSQNMHAWRRKNWKIRWDSRKRITVLVWGRSEIVVNGCLEDLEGRMRLKRMWKLIPQAGEKRNK